ncbi:MAG: c-type cytochrome [Deltaproteobacteria bacterium]|nr:c-type cytochrome [Deltaproteobacteria bacterium]
MKKFICLAAAVLFVAGASSLSFAQDVGAGKAIYNGKGMCKACHGKDGSKPFKLTKLFKGETYTVQELKEWIGKEAQMKMLKGKLTEKELADVNAYTNTLKK